MSKLHFYQHGEKKEFPIEFNTRTEKCKVLKYGIILFGRKLNIKYKKQNIFCLTHFVGSTFF